MRRRLSALVRAAAVAVVVTMVPAVLVRVGGDVVPSPSTALLREWIHEPLTPGFLAVVGLTAAWLLWALLATAVAARVYAWVSRLARWLPPIHLPRPLQGLTAAILGASAVTASGVAAHAAPAPATATLHEPATDVARTAADTAVRTDGRPTINPKPTHTVRRGESLSTIARHRLGDSDRWDDIFALNRGTRFPTGGTLTNPDLIRPGWTLDLPADSTARPATSPPKTPKPAAPTTPHDPTTSAPSSGNPTGENNSEGSQTAPTASTAPATSSPTASSPNPRPTAHPSSAPTTPCGIPVGRGGWMDLGLATAVVAAVALIWAHRRRRYRPRPPTAQLRLDDPSVQPMPMVVTNIRRALRQLAVSTPSTMPDTDRTEPVTTTDRLEQPAPSHLEQLTSPVTPALTGPLIEAPPAAGLGVTGPGAAAAARGFLLAALATGSPDDPDRRGHVVIPSGTLTTLLGAATATVPDTPRLVITDGLADALTLVEEETLRRTRLCVDHEVDTIAALRDADPLTGPLPPMLLLADADTRERARIAALLTQGQSLDIHGILLGAWPDGGTVVVADDGTTSPADSDADRHGRHPADAGRLSVIDPADAVDLLRVLAESHTGEPQPPASVEHTPQPRDDSTTHNDKKTDRVRDQAGHLRPETASSSADVEVAPVDSSPSETTRVEEDPPPRDRTDNQPAASGEPRRVEVRVLGDARIVDIDVTQPLRGKALELLVYLAARGGTASQEAILEDLLPEAATSKAPHRLHTYVYNLRRVLKRTGGATTYLSHPDRRYILHPDAIDVDLWRMGDALTQANRATTTADRTAALRRAVDAYQGPLAAGKSYEWIEPYREATQRQAIDAALALADALDDQPAEALAVLTTAISHSPHAEALYQASMRAHAALGDAAAIRDLRRQLARCLDEIDTDISDDTNALADTLINRLQRRPRIDGGSRTVR